MLWCTKGQQKSRPENRTAEYVGLVGGVVVEVALDVDNGGTLVAGAGGQVAERTDQVGQLTGGSTLGSHLTNQVAVLFTDLGVDRLLQLLAAQSGELVVCQILQLQLVGSTLQACGVCGRNNRVSQLPDLSYGILECAVAVNHNLNLFAGCLVNAFLNNTRISQASSEICNLPYTFPEPDTKIEMKGNSATTLSIIYSDSNSTQLNYSGSEGCYILSKNSMVKNDLLNDKPMKYDNVFILYANSTTYETEEDTQLILDTYTKGSGIYASNGKYVEITWERDISGNLVFFDAEGNRLTVNRGTSYMAFMKASSKSSVKIS